MEPYPPPEILFPLSFCPPPPATIPFPFFLFLTPLRFRAPDLVSGPKIIKKPLDCLPFPLTFRNTQLLPPLFAIFSISFLVRWHGLTAPPVRSPRSLTHPPPVLPAVSPLSPERPSPGVWAFFVLLARFQTPPPPVVFVPLKLFLVLDSVPSPQFSPRFFFFSFPLIILVSPLA